MAFNLKNSYLIVVMFNAERPKTPTMRSRIDEKNALIGLNNRLANILQRKQELEDENNLLSREVTKIPFKFFQNDTLLVKGLLTRLSISQNKKMGEIKMHTFLFHFLIVNCTEKLHQTCQCGIKPLKTYLHTHIYHRKFIYASKIMLLFQQVALLDKQISRLVKYFLYVLCVIHVASSRTGKYNQDTNPTSGHVRRGTGKCPQKFRRQREG